MINCPLCDTPLFKPSPFKDIVFAQYCTQELKEKSPYQSHYYYYPVAKKHIILVAPYRIDLIEPNGTLQAYSKDHKLTLNKIFYPTSLEEMIKLAKRLNSLKVFI
jgi:hypothetical protein